MGVAILTATIACADDLPADGQTTSSSASGAGGTTDGAGGSGGTTGIGGGGASSSGGGGEGPIGGSGGSGGSEAWPTCDTQPDGSPTRTIEEIWAEDPAAPSEAWVPGVYVTAVSRDGCMANQACQFFVQQDESYASIAEATHQSLRVAVAPSVAELFEGIAVGDQIDLYARAFRDIEDGKNELVFLIAPALPGCAAIVGAGDPAPIIVTLDVLTLVAYEEDVGPILVQVDTVSGNPNSPAETFALWDTGSVGGGGLDTVTSLSPFFLSGAAFVGLTDGLNTDFEFVVGVFAIFAPPADPLVKYEEIYVRSAADYPLAN